MRKAERRGGVINLGCGQLKARMAKAGENGGSRFMSG